MTWHTGRLLDHVHLRVADLAVSKRFYRAVAGVLGIAPSYDGNEALQIDELYLDAAEPGAVIGRTHIAFQARDRDMVHTFYEAAMAAGGRDNGPPGERHYHPGYYAAFVLDPDGHNVEAVYHGPSTRSAASVEIEPAG